MRILQKIKEIDVKTYDRPQHVKTSHFFPQFYHHRFFSGAMKFIAGIGDFGMIWLVLILLLSLNDKTQLLSQKMLAALILATVIGQVTIKSIVRPWPLVSRRSAARPISDHVIHIMMLKC